MLEKAKNELNNLIDTVAILIITSCVIPILTLLFMIWIIKLIFNVDFTKKTTKIEGE